jgi:hypothetical protein
MLKLISFLERRSASGPSLLTLSGTNRFFTGSEELHDFFFMGTEVPRDCVQMQKYYEVSNSRHHI